MSVYGRRVPDSGLAVLATLLAATRDVHTPRALARAIAATLSTLVPIVRIELDPRVDGPPIDLVIAERSGDDWNLMEVPPRAQHAPELVPGLAVVLRPRARPPACFAEPDFRAALAQVIAAALGHLAVVQRVAALSQRAHSSNRALRADLDRLAAPSPVVARSPVMRAVLERAALVARHATTVLLTGESGTGKEVLAREIHRLSPRATRPMLHINCGAIPDALVESELFGHERGAFTGADRAHPGVFERAHRGTLLLDEVGELPLAAQVKLLRVIQERQLRRVGGTVQQDVDVRLIAATNRPLAAMVRDGRFREDLYYRLDVFAIALPPLRERRGDLAPLASALIAQLAARLGLPAPPITRAALARLEAHAWPGNVRELANVLEAALILGGGDALALPDGFAPSHRTADLAPFAAAARETIEAALRATHGKIYGPGGAAAQLGLKPATLQSKMRKLRIVRMRFV